MLLDQRAHECLLFFFLLIISKLPLWNCLFSHPFTSSSYFHNLRIGGKWYRIFFKDFFFNVDHFLSLYWICYNIAFVYVLVFWAQGMWDLSSLKRDWSCISYIGRQSHNHWAAKGVSYYCCILHFLFYEWGWALILYVLGTSMPFFMNSLLIYFTCFFSSIIGLCLELIPELFAY